MNKRHSPMHFFTSPPQEVKRLGRRTGSLQPAGGVLYSEGDTRNFHEILFVMYRMIETQKRLSKGLQNTVMELFRYYAVRFRGWYGLDDLASQIEKSLGEMNFARRKECLEIIESLMTYVGRVNFWIDLLIPWYDLNEHMKTKRK
jgi:hypothetical protein